MGNRVTSAAPIISPAEARAHLTDDEFNRLQNAFGRIKKSQLNLDDFSRHVLGGANVPDDARLALFKFFSRGGDTISFDNLISALVGICRIEEVQGNFIEEHREFASWGLRPPRLTIPVNDSYINFFEVMSYVTHLSVKEVEDLESVYSTLAGKGGVKLLPSQWTAATAGCFPFSFTQRLFRIFDENRDGEVDFREMVCGVSAMCRGPLPSRLSFLAKLWDEDGDNLLSVAELNAMYDELNVPVASRTVCLSAKGGQLAAMVDFASWAMQDTNEELVDCFYSMALEIGHICFGLRPENAQTELRTVTGFIKRLGQSTNDVSDWNVISMGWYRQWEKALQRAVGAVASTHHEPPPPLDNSSLLSVAEAFPGSSKLPCLSLESTCLRRDLTPQEWEAIPRCLYKALVRWHGQIKNADIIRRRLAESELSLDGEMELFPLHVVFERRRAGGQQNGVQSIYSWAYAQASRASSISQLSWLAARELHVSESELRLWLSSGRPPSPSPSLNSNCSTATSGYGSSSPCSPSGGALLDDPLQTLAELQVGDGCAPIRVLVEVRERATGVWPEEARLARTGQSIAQSSARGAAVGLINYGNFCYRNAAVQCIARVSPLSEYLLSKESELTALAAKKKDKKAVAAALQFIQLLRQMTNSAKKNISPVQFNEAIRDTKAFDGGEQHDCEEFVSFLLNQLHYTLREGEGATALAEKKEEGKGEEKKEEELEDSVKAKQAWQSYMAAESSLVTSLFSGQLRSSLVCRRCSAASSTFDVFTLLPVPIGFEHVELYEITVVRRDASIPLRYGVRLSRDSAVSTLRECVAEAAGLPKERLSLFRIDSQAAQRLRELLDSDAVGRQSERSQLYALERAGEGRLSLPAVHRRMQLNREAYLLGAAAGCTASIFGVPIPVDAPAGVETTSLSLYEDVWRQLGRLICTPPPSFASRATDPCEDASAGYPFTLSLVDSSLEWCATCPALRFCRGCPLLPDASERRLQGAESAAIAVDWQPIALYLKYNHSQTLSCADEPGLARVRELHARPSTLAACLRRFAAPEVLEDAMECKKCKQKTQREKIMAMWKLPRFLIIQLKRFEYVREEGRIGKCKRLIDFPLSGLDAAPFLDGKKGPPSPLLYDCIAIANHYGELQAGHFVAYARAKGDAWLLLNDCTVREVTEEQVDKAGAYLLFYERRDEEEEDEDEEGLSHL